MLSASSFSGTVSNVLRLLLHHHRIHGHHHHRRAAAAAALPLLLAASTSVSSFSSLPLVVTTPGQSPPHHHSEGVSGGRRRHSRPRPTTHLPLARRSPSTRRGGSSTAKRRRRGRRRSSSSSDGYSKEEDRDDMHDHHLVFYTCQHTYEDTLMDELRRMEEEEESFPIINQDDDALFGFRDGGHGSGRMRGRGRRRRLLSLSSPCPGLVRAAYGRSDDDDDDEFEIVREDDESRLLRDVYDPVYALQVLPSAVEVSAPSIKGLAMGALSSLNLVHDNLNDAVDDSIPNRSAATVSYDTDDGNDQESRTTPTTLKEELRSAPRGSLTVHALVPAMLKGTTNRPRMERRARNVAESATEQLRKLYPCARRRARARVGASVEGAAAVLGTAGDDDDAGESRRDDQRPAFAWILQLLLLGPEELVASLSPVRYLGSPNSMDRRIPPPSWPCVTFPAGLANAEEHDESEDVGEDDGLDKNPGRRFVLRTAERGAIGAPSSAYRKLLEAVSCMGLVPRVGSTVYDLGASPGGWTSVLRRMGCDVVAVDRSDLDPSLMADPHVTFVRGDAFAYAPPPPEKTTMDDGGYNDDDDDDQRRDRRPPRWMVSDVIAYPERVAELVDKWFGGPRRLAEVAVVTVKFKGDVPDWDALSVAADAARRPGTGEDDDGNGATMLVRAKHFFNNKNEVTLMIAVVDGVKNVRDESSSKHPWSRRPVGFVPRAMFPVAWP